MTHRFAMLVRRRSGIAIAASGLLVATLLTTSAGPAAAQGAGDWPAYLDGPGHSSFNAAATAITPGSVPSLQQVWKWATPASPNDGSNRLWASPTVVDGVVYVGALDGYFYAIDEATQTVLWSDFLGLDEAKGAMPCGPNGQGIISTATVADDPVTGAPTVFVNAPDGNLYALDAGTGAVVWAGQVDTPLTTVNDYYSWGSPLVANGDVYVGISSDCDAPLVPGGMVSFNQSTGAQVAQWIDVPPGKQAERRQRLVQPRARGQRGHRRHHGQRLQGQRGAAVQPVDRRARPEHALGARLLAGPGLPGDKRR